MSETKTRMCDLCGGPLGAGTKHHPEDRLTRQQTAAHLIISLPRLAQLRREGKIKHEKNPETRAVRYRFADVERLHHERTRVVLGV